MMPYSFMLVIIVIHINGGIYDTFTIPVLVMFSL